MNRTDKFVIRSLSIFGFIAYFFVAGEGQTASDLWRNPETDDFNTIREQVEQYFQGKDKGRGSGYKQWKRWENYNQYRLTEEGKIANTTMRNWEAFHEYKEVFEQKGGGSLFKSNGYWHQLAPTSFTEGTGGYGGGLGRINTIAYHPTLPGTIYAGAPAGGLWKTTDYGSSWMPLTDGMPVIGITGIAINYNDPDIIYILTGDRDGGQTYSIGILKTTDGGNSWQETGMNWLVEDARLGKAFAMHPEDPEILFVSDGYKLHRTTNGGEDWQAVLNSSVVDIKFKPGSPDVVYAADKKGVYKSQNGGIDWSKTDVLAVACSRSVIAVSPASPEVVYYLAGKSEVPGEFYGIYRSLNSGQSFSLTTDTPNILGSEYDGSGYKNQAYYDLALAVSPQNASILTVGAINIWRSSNYGFDFSLITYWNSKVAEVEGYQYTHADIHHLSYNPLDNSLYCGSDGGVFRSTDYGQTWTDISQGLCITQFYKIAGTEANSNLIIGGAQDNGSNRWTGGSNMVHYDGADGMDCMIDPNNSNIQYHSRQYGSLFKSLDGGVTFDSIYPVYGGWVTHFVMNPSNPQVIYGSYNSVYKTLDGGLNWYETTGNGGGPIAIGTSNTNRVYVTSSGGGSIYRSDNGGVDWSYAGSTLPIGITGIAVDPNNSLRVYVSVGNYKDGNKVFKTIDGGANWENISGTLPNVPVNCIVYENTGGSPDEALYIGTDIGVFYKNSGMSDWIPYQNGLPSVLVFDLEINHVAGVIRAGTFGRGLWSSPLFADCPQAFNLTQANDPSNPNYTGVQHYEATDKVMSSRIITGGVGTDVTYKAGNSVVLYPGFHAKEDNKFKAILGTCNAKGQVNGYVEVKGCLMETTAPSNSNERLQQN